MIRYIAFSDSAALQSAYRRATAVYVASERRKAGRRAGEHYCKAWRGDTFLGWVPEPAQLSCVRMLDTGSGGLLLVPPDADAFSGLDDMEGGTLDLRTGLVDEDQLSTRWRNYLTSLRSG